MRKVADLTKMVFSGLFSLVIDDVSDEGERILMSARTPKGAVTCPGCATGTGRGTRVSPADPRRPAGRCPAGRGLGTRAPSGMPHTGCRQPCRE